MFKQTLQVGLVLDDVLAEQEDGLVCNSYYKNLFVNPLGMDIAKWCMQRMNDRKPRTELSIFARRYAVHIKVTEDWLRNNRVPYVRLYVNPNLDGSIAFYKPDIIVSDKISTCMNAYHKYDCKPVLIENQYNETPWFPRIRTLQGFQTVYKAVADEKLLTDFDGARMAPNLSGF